MKVLFYVDQAEGNAKQTEIGVESPQFVKVVKRFKCNSTFH